MRSENRFCIRTYPCAYRASRCASVPPVRLRRLSL